MDKRKLEYAYYTILGTTILIIMLFSAALALKSVELHSIGFHNMDLAHNMIMFAKDNGYRDDQIVDVSMIVDGIESNYTTTYYASTYTEAYISGIDQMTFSFWSFGVSSAAFVFSFMLFFDVTQTLGKMTAEFEKEKLSKDYRDNYEWKKEN